MPVEADRSEPAGAIVVAAAVCVTEQFTLPSDDGFELSEDLFKETTGEGGNALAEGAIPLVYCAPFSF